MSEKKMNGIFYDRIDLTYSIRSSAIACSLVRFAEGLLFSFNWHSIQENLEKILRSILTQTFE